MSTERQTSQPVPIAPRQRTESLQSTDSEILSASSPSHRKFSFTEMFGSRTSINEAYQKYSGFTINGDGFRREDYLTKKDASGGQHRDHHQEYFLP